MIYWRRAQLIAKFLYHKRTENRVRGWFSDRANIIILLWHERFENEKAG